MVQLGYVPNCTISCERGGRTPCVRRPTIEPEGGVPRAKLGFSISLQVELTTARSRQTERGALKEEGCVLLHAPDD